MKVVVVIKDYRVSIEEKCLRELRFGEVLVKIEYCGVCYIDLYVKNVDFGDVIGVILGYEGIGCVIKIVDNVDLLKVGDCVFIVWMYVVCGNCEYCIIGREILCRDVFNVGYIVDGVMVEEVIVDVNYVVKVFENFDLVVVLFIICVGVIIYKVVKVSGIELG